VLGEFLFIIHLALGDFKGVLDSGLQLKDAGVMVTVMFGPEVGVLNLVNQFDFYVECETNVIELTGDVTLFLVFDRKCRVVVDLTETQIAEFSYNSFFLSIPVSINKDLFILFYESSNVFLHFTLV
jgi:hypothetical protein